MEWNTWYSDYNTEILSQNVNNNLKLVWENTYFVIENKSYAWG